MLFEERKKGKTFVGVFASVSPSLWSRWRCLLVIAATRLDERRIAISALCKVI